MGSLNVTSAPTMPVQLGSRQWGRAMPWPRPVGLIFSLAISDRYSSPSSRRGSHAAINWAPCSIALFLLLTSRPQNVREGERIEAMRLEQTLRRPDCPLYYRQTLQTARGFKAGFADELMAFLGVTPSRLIRLGADNASENSDTSVSIATLNRLQSVCLTQALEVGRSPLILTHVVC